MDPHDPPDTEPSSALQDERLQFFLENRDLIRTWAALSDEVEQAVEDTQWRRRTPRSRPPKHGVQRRTPNSQRSLRHRRLR